MTHEWVEQKNKEWQERFKNYPQALVDEWNRIPAWAKDVIHSTEIDLAMKLFAALAELGRAPKQFDVWRVANELDSSNVVTWFKWFKEDTEETKTELEAVQKEFKPIHEMFEGYQSYLYNSTPYDKAEDQIMEFDGDIIITDPCYLRRRDDNEFNDQNLGERGIHGISAQTFYGDWSCHTFDSINKDEDGDPKVLGQFCADGGMVCVADLKTVLKYNPDFNFHKERDWTTTWIDNFKGTVTIKIDQNTEEWPAYIVHVVGKGIDKETGEPIEFDTMQTGL